MSLRMQACSRLSSTSYASSASHATRRSLTRQHRCKGQDNLFSRAMGEFNSRMNALGTGLGIGKKKAAPAPQAHHQNDMIEGATTELGRAAGALFVSVTMQGGEGQSITNTLSYLLHVMSVPHTSSVAVSEGLHSTTLTKEDTMRPFVVTLDTCQGMVANSSLHDSLERLQSASQEDHEEVVTFLGILGVVASRKDPLTALACINRAKEIVLTDAAELPAEHIDLVTKEAVVLNVLKLHERAHDVSYEGFSRLLADGEEVYAMYGVVDMGLQLAFALFNMQRSEEALKVLTRVSGVKRIPLVIRNSYNILREAVEADVARHVDPLLPLPQASQLWVTYSALRRIPEVSALSLNHAPETTLKVLAQSFEALLAGKEGGEGGGGGEEGEGEGEGAQSESEALVTPVLRNIGSVVVYVDQGEGLESMQEGNVRVCICDNAEEELLKDFTEAVKSNGNLVPGVAMVLDSTTTEQRIGTLLRAVEAEGTIATMPPAALWMKYLSAVLSRSRSAVTTPRPEIPLPNPTARSKRGST